MHGAQRTTNLRFRSSLIRRQILLVLVLALLIVLILAVTANAYVAQRTNDTLSDFDRGTFTFTGLLDIPERDIDSVQLLPVGLTGEMELSPLHLPRPLVDHATIAIGDVIYVIGGTDQTFLTRAEVYFSTISDDQGTLSPWQQQTDLPDFRAGSGIAAYRNSASSSTLYAIGGFDGDYYLTDTVFRAQIDVTSGQMVGGWTGEAHHLPRPLTYAPAVEHDGLLYVLGGSGDSESFVNVYKAPINSDGSLGEAFSETSPLPKPLFYGYAVVYDGALTDTLYYVGGMYYDNVGERFASEEVYYADFLPGGGLTEWNRSEGALPRTLYGHSGVLVNGVELIVTGGIGNPIHPEETITSTVKAALVDPDNSNFRLYNWCEHVPEPCNLGAWQTGGLLPTVRALHGTVTGRDHIYVLGGQDADQDATDTIFFGSIQGQGALYAPAGQYRSEKLDLEQPATLRKLTWQASITPTGQVTLTMQYRTSADGGLWSEWSEPVISQDGLNEIDQFPGLGSIRYVQYEADFTTVLTHASPRLDEVHIFYEVPDPDLSVIKDTGSVITATLGGELQYTIRYSNTGGWVAEDAILTEALPEHTSYAGGPEWHQVGSSNLYTRSIGDVGRGETGSSTFKVKVDNEVPPGVLSIDNRIEIDYPPMIDALGDVITDPNDDDNWYEFSNLLSAFGLAVTKEADPPAGTVVTPGSLITYTLRYTNVGTIRASQVVLTDTFDAYDGYTIVTPSVPPGTREYVWHLDSLGPRQTGEKQVVVQLQDPLPNHWTVTNQGSLYSPEGDPYHTPVITHPVLSPPGTPMVDLVVTDVSWQPTDPVSGTWPMFTAAIVNTGTKVASDDFWVSLYIKPRPSAAPAWPADHDGGYCLHGCTITRGEYVKSVSTLGPGEGIQVVFGALPTDDPPPYSPAAGTYDIYVQVDVAFEGDNVFWGRHAEDREDNNIRHETLSLRDSEPSGPPKVYLPAILRSSP